MNRKFAMAQIQNTGTGGQADSRKIVLVAR
jgi:hypothetical protein